MRSKSLNRGRLLMRQVLFAWPMRIASANGVFARIVLGPNALHDCALAMACLLSHSLPTWFSTDVWNDLITSLTRHAPVAITEGARSRQKVVCVACIRTL